MRVKAPWTFGVQFILLFLVLAGRVFSALEPMSVSPAVKAPVIDGVLSNDEWALALKVDRFKTFQPDYGKEPSQRTEAYLAYDSENFYVALRCYDTEPGKIKSSVSKRDSTDMDDFAGFLIDTFNDMQSAFGFIINPMGIQMDGMMNIQGNMSSDYDMVWYSKGRIDDQGYTVECRVPLKSLRFPNRKTITMRVAFFRQIIRTSEMDSYPPLFPDKGSLLGQTLPIVVTGLKYHRVVEVLPALTHSSDFEQSDGTLRHTDSLTDFSLTGKFGITSDLTLDGTYNPDFSQVEADAGQVDINLRYELYFPEKRPFFLEGSELWEFAANMEDSPLMMLVHTRTIIDPVMGFKLSGKITPKDTIAAIYARDELPDDEVDVHPDFNIFRYRHALKEDSYIGAFYTARMAGQGFNRVAGADGRFRLSMTSLLSFHLFGSFSKADGAGDMNPGHALSLNYAYGTRTVNLELGYQDISRDFQVDTGYLTRTGVRRLALFGMYTFYPKSKFFQRIEPFYWSYHLIDTPSNLFETMNVLVLRFWLPRSTQVRFEALLGNEVFEGERLNISKFGLQMNTQITKQLFLFGRFRRGWKIYYDPDDPYQGYGNTFVTEAAFQPTDKLSFGLSLTYVDFYRQSTKEKVYDYLLIWNRNTFQVNKYLFVRAILEYNTYRKRLTVDGLVSFTYIPGTVFYVGYGAAMQKLEWDGADYVESDRFLEMRRGFFFKVSYLWRL